MAQLFEKTANGWQEILPDALDFYTGIEARGITWNDEHHVIATIAVLRMFDRAGRRVPASDVILPDGVYARSQRRELRGLTWEPENSRYWVVSKGRNDHDTSDSVRIAEVSSAGVLGSTLNIASDAQAVIWDGSLLNVVFEAGTVRRYTTALVQSGSTITLPSGLDDLNGGVFVPDTSKFYLVDDSDEKMYVFADTWTRAADDDFDLAVHDGDEARNNVNAAGVSWDGRFLRVADKNYFRRKVFTYELDGTYLGAA